ncbi:MAG: Gfo/Idh/MocA family oxidoreductase, partial [Trueperaceae bacterium]|nr:Gfo/Idh/MocA family oxidoreductase [Trueperaceae bacterium]
MARHVARPFTAPPELTGRQNPDPFTATGPALRWGVVSTGKIAHTVTAQLARLEDARLQAVSSRDAAKAAAFATQYGFRASYGGAGGYEALAEDPDVDVVYVATPHGQHHAVAGAMLRAGKHVLVEKAFTITAAEAEDLARLARDRGLFLMEAVWTRFLPTYVAAMDVLESGELGPVRYVQADMGFMAERDPRTRLWAPVDGGGALLDLAVYPLCWVIGALGLPTGARATGNVNRDGVDELCALALTHAGGAHSQVVVSFVSDSTRRARIVGT